MHAQTSALPLFTSLLLSLSGPIAAPMQAADWPQFRGPDRNGISAETGLANNWPEAGPPELWRHSIGESFSGIVAVDGALYTTMSDAEGDHAVRLDPANGGTVWRARLAPPYVESFGGGPRVAPTVDGDRLYALSGDGHLAAIERGDGKVSWSLDLRKTFGVELPTWGFASSPLVLDDLLILDVGAPDAAVIAFDKGTGKVRWKVGSEGNAYSSPVVHEIGGRRQIILLRQSGLLGLSPEGRELWRYEWATSGGIKPAMPIFVAPDLLIASASYGIGALAVRLRTVDGVTTPEEVWQSQVMRNHFNSSVLIDGKIYGFDNATLKCVDPATGEQLWAQRRGLGKGSLIAADGLLIVLTENGAIKLVEATPSGYYELASHPVLTGRSWTEPTLADGRLYLRNREEIVALDLRARGGAAPAITRRDAATPAALSDLTRDQILRRHSEAVGDIADLRAGQGLRIRGTYDAEGVPSPFTLTVAWSGAYRLEVHADDGDRIQASDGATAWTEDPRDGAKILDEAEASLVIHDLATFAIPLLPAPGDGVRLELVGKADLDGRPAHHLRAHLPGDQTEEWYVDPDDFLVRRKDVAAISPWWGDYTRVYWYHRHAEHFGAQVPVFMERIDDTFVKLFHVESVERLDRLEAARFAAPASGSADQD